MNPGRTQPKVRWTVFGESVRGASHERHGLPNQDAITWTPPANQEGPIVLAVSDGHGSAKCFRSDVGARAAVETALELLTAFARRHPNPPASRNAGDGRAADELREQLVRTWTARVDEHLRRHPFTPAELEGVAARDGAAARRVVEDSPLVAYGATLLATLLTDQYLLHLQLGDGDILTVSDSGTVTRPVPADERLIANETTSLCSASAARDIRIIVSELQSPPALVLLSTDGYSNSFRDDPSFTRVGTDLLQLISTQGAAHVVENLGAWLTEASTYGSGDDVTVGVVVRCGLTEGDPVARRPPPPAPEPRPSGGQGAATAPRPSAPLPGEKPMIPEEEWAAWSRSVSLGMQRLGLGILFALFASGFSFGVAVLLLVARLGPHR